MLQDIEKLNLLGHSGGGQVGHQEAFQLRLLCEFKENSAAILTVLFHHAT